MFSTECYDGVDETCFCLRNMLKCADSNNNETSSQMSQFRSKFSCDYGVVIERLIYKYTSMETLLEEFRCIVSQQNSFFFCFTSALRHINY